MKKLTNEEKILQVLQGKGKHRAEIIYIYKEDFSSLKLREKDIIHALLILSKKGLISIKSKSTQNKLNIPWRISIEAAGTDYFQNREMLKSENRRKLLEEIRAWITLLISILAFVLSILSLYLQYASKQ